MIHILLFTNNIQFHYFWIIKLINEVYGGSNNYFTKFENVSQSFYILTTKEFHFTTPHTHIKYLINQTYYIVLNDELLYPIEF